MNDTNKHILDTIRTCVWSGFYNSNDVQQLIDDILGEDSDEAMLRSAVAPEFEKKAAAQASWPEETDCDRLDQVFSILNSSGIIALQNAGYTISDGLSDVGQELHQRGSTNIRGYCFYHGQDLERAVSGGGLMLAFGDLNDNKTAQAEIGRIVTDVVEANGFHAEWNGDPETRISIPNIDWKRRSSQ